MTVAAGEDGGGIVEAKRHGYRPVTLGKKKCGGCKYAGDSELRDAVRCTMFDFWASVRGVCDEWAAK